jgi:hypothetical protein
VIFRFRRRVRLVRGVTFNLSKLMAWLSVGPQGAKFTLSQRANRATAGITGTGLRRHGVPASADFLRPTRRCDRRRSARLQHGNCPQIDLFSVCLQPGRS